MHHRTCQIKQTQKKSKYPNKKTLHSLQVPRWFPPRLLLVPLHQDVGGGQDGTAAHAHLQSHHDAQPPRGQRAHSEQQQGKQRRRQGGRRLRAEAGEGHLRGYQADAQLALTPTGGGLEGDRVHPQLTSQEEEKARENSTSDRQRKPQTGQQAVPPDVSGSIIRGWHFALNAKVLMRSWSFNETKTIGRNF